MDISKMLFALRFLAFISVFWCGLSAHADLLLTKVGGNAAVSFVATDNCSAIDVGNTTTVACTLTVGIGGATVVVMTAEGTGGTVSSVSDGTNTYTKLIAGSGSEDAEIWYVLNPASVSAGGIVTVTYGVANVIKYIHVVSLNKVAATDQTGSDTGVSNVPSCVTGGSVAVGSAAFGIVIGNPSVVTATQPTGFTGTVQGPVGAASVIDGSQIVSAAGAKTYNPGGFGVVVWSCAVGSFK